jgi:hypothetical protein
MAVEIITTAKNVLKDAILDVLMLLTIHLWMVPKYITGQLLTEVAIT